MVLGNSIYEDFSHEATRVFRSSTLSLAQTRHQRSNVAVSLPSAIGTPTSERRTSDESPIKNFTAVTQLDRRGSGSATFVPMIKPAHRWDRDDPPSFRSLDRA